MDIKKTDKRKVILVTDGDTVAKRAVESASRDLGARCISCSAGNPTALTGEQIVSLIKKAPYDPVVVMLDDKGYHGQGKGERALVHLATHPEIEVLGVLAVASNTENTGPATVNCSVTSTGQISPLAVNKSGNIKADLTTSLTGDTVEVLDSLNIPVVVGIGDIGKMYGADDPDRGAPVTTKALKEILNRSGYNDCGTKPGYQAH